MTVRRSILGRWPALFAPLATALAVAGCGGPSAPTSGPPRVDLPVTDGLRRDPRARAAAKESPPPSSASREATFPPVARSTLANGMGLDVVTVPTLPIVQVRLVVRAGANYGSAPAVGEITASMLKDGGTRAMSSAELLRRVESLGADLVVRSEPDATVLSLALTKDRLGEGLAILSQVVREPRFDEAELRRLKARSIDEIEDAARSRGRWAATWLLFHELYPERHPYRLYSPLGSHVAKIDGAQIREFYRTFFVPKAATLVLAGDVDAATASALAQKHFGGWTGHDPPKVDFPPPRPIGERRVVVAHRPKSVQSEVNVAVLAPGRTAPTWPALRVANQVFGGGVASRLFSDVREQRGLAYTAAALILELSHGDQPLIVYAATETSRTAEATGALLENMRRMTVEPPSATETAEARRFLGDAFAIRMETVGSIAEMVVTQETFGLPLGYWDTYKQELLATSERKVADAAKLYGSAALVVVAGDADVIAPSLARFGEVTVYDPEKEFRVIKTLPKTRDR